MISLYVGIDPSINSTGICVQSYHDNNHIRTRFYIVHGGRLTKRENEESERLSGILDIIEYDKIDASIYKKKDNSEFEVAKTKNLISIVSYVSEILNKVSSQLSIEYPGEDISTYVTIEANSFNSRSRSVSLIELCGLNFLIRREMLSRHLTQLIVGTPSEMKKYATSKGNADKELVKMVFLTKHPEFKNSVLKIDDIADAYFMSCYSYKVANGIENGYIRENGLSDILKIESEKMKSRKKSESESKKMKKQAKQLAENNINKEDLESV